MNLIQLGYIKKVIDSCVTTEQLDITLDWMFRLKPIWKYFNHTDVLKYFKKKLDKIQKICYHKDNNKR